MFALTLADLRSDNPYLVKEPWRRQQAKPYFASALFGSDLRRLVVGGRRQLGQWPRRDFDHRRRVEVLALPAPSVSKRLAWVSTWLSKLPTIWL